MSNKRVVVCLLIREDMRRNRATCVRTKPQYLGFDTE